MASDARNMSASDYGAKYGDNLYLAGVTTQMWNPWIGREVTDGKYSGGWMEVNFSVMATIVMKGYTIKTNATAEYYEGQTQGSQFIGDQWLDIAFLVNDAAQAIYESRTYATALAYKLQTIPIHLPLGLGVIRPPMSVLKPLSSIVNGAAKVAPFVAAAAITTNVLVNSQITWGDAYMTTVTGFSIIPGLGLIVGGGALIAEGVSYGFTGQSISANINERNNGGVIIGWGGNK